MEYKKIAYRFSPIRGLVEIWSKKNFFDRKGEKNDVKNKIDLTKNSVDSTLQEENTKIENLDPMLSFEEFTEPKIISVGLEGRKYNNFIDYFDNDGGNYAEVYRGKMHYQKFAERYPHQNEVTATLVTGKTKEEHIKNLLSKVNCLKEQGAPQEKESLRQYKETLQQLQDKLLIIEKSLYEAYKLMRQFVTSDHLLFA